MAKRLKVDLQIEADGTYSCSSTKSFTEQFNINQEVDAGTVASNNAQFITLSSSSKAPAAASFHNAKAILIKNTSKGVDKHKTCTSFLVYLPPIYNPTEATERFIEIYSEKGRILC